MSKRSSAAVSGKLKQFPPDMALAILESAVAYCQAAGLAVRVDSLPGAEHQAAGALVITVTGAQSVVVDGVTHMTPLPAPLAEALAEHLADDTAGAPVTVTPEPAP